MYHTLGKVTLSDQETNITNKKGIQDIKVTAVMPLMKT